jgi:hypothetical protein
VVAVARPDHHQTVTHVHPTTEGTSMDTTTEQTAPTNERTPEEQDLIDALYELYLDPYRDTKHWRLLVIDEYQGDLSWDDVQRCDRLAYESAHETPDDRRPW